MIAFTNLPNLLLKVLLKYSLLYSVAFMILGQSSCNSESEFITTLRATFSPLIHKVLITYASSIPKLKF